MRGVLNYSEIGIRIWLPVLLLTQKACSPGSRFLPCVPRNLMHTNKNIAPPFKSLRHKAVYAAPHISVEIKNPACAGF